MDCSSSEYLHSHPAVVKWDGLIERLPAATTGKKSAQHEATEPIRSVENNVSLVDIPAVEHVQSGYLDINNELKNHYSYYPICLSGHPAMPDDIFDRRGWLGNMAFSVSVSHYTDHQGNYKGNSDFVWKTLPDNSSERIRCCQCMQHVR